MASAIAGIVAGLVNSGSGSGGGGGQGSGVITPYSPTGLGSADTSWQTLLSGLMGETTGAYGGGTGATVPLIDQAMQNMYANIYGPNNTPSAGLLAEQAAANAAGTDYGLLANQSNNMANIMQQQAGRDYTNAGAMTAAGNQVWNTASDPNQAIYNNLLNQTNQQANSASSLRGIGMSPEAAGLQNQADQSLNLGWQQQQLQNQIAGLGAMGSAYNQAGQQGIAGQQGLIQAQEMNALMPQLELQSATTPYNMSSQIAQSPITMANTIASANAQDVQNPLQSLMGMIIPYMNYGAGAQQSTFDAGQTNLGNFSGLGALGGGSLAKYFSTLPNPFSGTTSDGGSPWTPGVGAYVPYDPSGNYG